MRAPSSGGGLDVELRRGLLVGGARDGGEDVLDAGDAVTEGARRGPGHERTGTIDQLICYCDLRLRSAQTQYKEQMYEIFCINN